ncbi:hypothetical protein HK096_006094 [Nowakowskiella sp. JEL0078]|nr:hypothetical protein HK096_006094 [Nowakowskiella sp. JEL0078]
MTSHENSTLNDLQLKETPVSKRFLTSIYCDETEESGMTIFENLAFFVGEFYLLLLVLDYDITGLPFRLHFGSPSFEQSKEYLVIILVIEIFTLILSLVCFRQIQTSGIKEKTSAASTGNTSKINQSSYLRLLLKILIVLQGSTFLMPITDAISRAIKCGLTQSSSCYSSSALILGVLSCIVGVPLALFVFLLTILTMINCKPTNRFSPHIKSHNRLDMILKPLEILLVIIAVVSSDSIFVRNVSNLTVIGLILVLSLRIQPFFYPFYNNLRNCVLGGSFCISTLTLVISPNIGLGFYWASVLSLSIVGFAGGYLGSIYAKKWLTSSFLNKVRHAAKMRNEFSVAHGQINRLSTTGVNPNHIPHGLKIESFGLSLDVEFLARSIVFQNRLTGLNENEISDFKLVFDQGVHEFPECACVLIHFALYQSAFHITSDRAVYTFLSKAELRRPFFDMAVIINSETEKLRVSGGEMTYEFDRCMTVAQTNHSRAHQSVIDCWKFVLNNPEKLHCLPEYAEKLTTAIQLATDSYKVVMKRWPNRKEVQISYAEFLSNVKRDQVRSAIIEAEIEETQSQRNSEVSINKFENSNTRNSSSTKMRYSRARRSTISGSASQNETSMKIRKRKPNQNKKAHDIRKELDAQLRWNLDGYATTLNVGSAFVLILMFICLFLFWSLDQTISSEILARKFLSTIHRDLARSSLGVRRMWMASNSIGVKFSNSNSYSDYENFRLFAAKSSTMSYAAVRGQWKKSLDLGLDFQNSMMQEIYIVQRMYPWVWNDSLLENRIPLLLGISSMSESASVLSDLSYYDMNSIVSSANFDPSTFSESSSNVINYFYYVLDNGVIRVPRSMNQLKSQNSSVISVFEGIENLITDFSKFHKVTWADITTSLYLTYGLSIIILFIFAFSFVKQGLNVLLKQQRRALKVFLTLPNSLVQSMISALEKSAPWSEKDGSRILNGSPEKVSNGLEFSNSDELNPQIADLNSPTTVTAQTPGYLQITIPNEQNLDIEPVETTVLKKSRISGDDDKSSTQILTERRRMYNLIGILILLQCSLVTIIVAYNFKLNQEFTRQETIGNLSSLTVRTITTAYEAYWADPNIFDTREHAVAILEKNLEDLEPLRDYLADSSAYRSDTELKFLSQSCYAKNDLLCQYREYLGAGYPQYVATSNGFLFLMSNFILLAEKLVEQYDNNDMFAIEATLRYFDDVFLNDLLDGLTTYETEVVFSDIDDVRNLFYKLFIGFWVLSALLSTGNFLLMRSAVKRVRYHFSNTWELLVLIPPSAHENIPQLADFVKKLSKKTQSERGFFANFWGYLNGNADGTSAKYVQMDFTEKKEPEKSTKPNLWTRTKQKTGFGLWIHFEFFRDMCSKELNEADQRKIFLLRRRLPNIKMGTAHAWALGYLVVSTGQFSGWNSGVNLGGPGGFLVASGIAFINFLCVAGSLARMQTKYPASVGGIINYSHKVGFHSMFAFLAASLELLEYIIFIALIVSTIVGLLQSLAGTSNLMYITFTIATTAASMILLNYVERKIWQILFFGNCFTIAILIFFSSWGVSDFSLDKLLASQSPTLPVPSSLINQWFVNGYSGILLAIVPAYWLFVGLESIVLVSSEIKTPEKSISRALYSTTFTLGFTGFLISIFLIGVGPGAYLMSQATYPIATYTTYKLGTSYSALGNILVLPTYILNLIALILVGGRRMWSLSGVGLYPRWLSITSWDTDASGSSPVRSKAVVLILSVFFNIFIFLQIYFGYGNDQLTLITYMCVESAMCYYFCIGVVQLKVAFDDVKETGWKHSVGVVRGLILIILNGYILVVETAEYLLKVPRVRKVSLFCVFFAYRLFIAAEGNFTETASSNLGSGRVAISSSEVGLRVMISFFE